MNEMNHNSGETQQKTSRCIRCPDCGEEIMMVPVLSQMIEAIENHISTHKVHGAPALKEDMPLRHPKAPEIREDLTEQVLLRAVEIGDALNKNQNWVNQP